MQDIYVAKPHLTVIHNNNEMLWIVANQTTLIMTFSFVWRGLKVRLPVGTTSAIYFIQKVFSRLLGRGKPHTISIPVKHSVVLPDEYVSQDPQGPCRRWDIHGHEA